MTPRIAIERTVLELDAAGTARAVRGLLGALRERPDVEVVEVGHPGAAPESTAARVARGLDRELRWFWLGLPRAVRRAGADVLHLPATIGPWRSPAPLVVTVHDVLALERPEWFGRANALQQRVAVRRLARAARVVVAPSAYTAERLEALTGVRARVVPWGVDARFSPGPGPDRPPYVLAVGTLQPRKGLAELAAAVPPSHRLLVAGAHGWGQVDAGGAELLGRVSDEELVTLLRGADALVQASRGEGFGFPPLEAMACGTPVVAVRAGAAPEVVGDGGVVTDDLAGALRELLEDPARRAELGRRALARAARFTWAACAEGYVDAYREALA